MTTRCLHCGLKVTALGVLVHDVAGKAYRMHGPCPRLYREHWRASAKHTGPELAPDASATLAPQSKHIAIEWK